MYASIALSGLLAAAVSASPVWSNQNQNPGLFPRQNVSIGIVNQVTVELRGPLAESVTNFLNVQARTALPPARRSGPFDTVNINLDNSAFNQDLRCQLLDQDRLPIVATRGENVDITFSDGEGGEWTFLQKNQHVSEIICDPDFIKADPVDLQVIVALLNEEERFAHLSTFNDPTIRNEEILHVDTPAKTIEIFVGQLVEYQTLRCKIFDDANQEIRAIRGENNDVSFSDAGNGLWNLVEPAIVSRVVCNPRFVAKPL